MSSKSDKIMSENIIENSDCCVVCFKDFDLYSIGECDHPVCVECSTRMRVLCRHSDCPICRQDLSKVIFTADKIPYRQLETKNRSGLYDKKYRICFATLNIQDAFYKLLENPCPKCDAGPFQTFDILKEHVRKAHEYYYCDICSENLNIFSFERKCYTRQELALHRRKGDVDNTSHRGHPSCQFCDLRYLDRDELFRHLRREHFYCHFCDADGSNEFYGDVVALRKHFKAEHYLCEEGDCAQEQFTAVFRTDIDLKAHNASNHCRLLGNRAAKQARTLEFEFVLAPRNRNGANQNNNGGETFRNSMRVRNEPEIEFDGNNIDGGGGDMNLIQQHRQRVIDSQNEQEFPSLSGSGGATGVTFLRQNMSISAKSYGTGTKALARTKENFPALGGNESTTELEPGPSLAQRTTGGHFTNKNSSSSILKTSTNPSSVQPKKIVTGGGMLIHVSNRPPNLKQQQSNDFPALPASNNKLKQNFKYVDNNLKYLDMDDNLSQPPTNSLLATNIVSSKHKTLVNDDYQSFNPLMSTKITLVQKENIELLSPKKTPIKVLPPQLNSSDSFPALERSTVPLGLSSKWGVPKKVEPRKSKVAAAPNLTNNNYNTTTTTNNNNINGGNTTSRNNVLNNKNKTDKIPHQKNQLNGTATTTTTSTSINNQNKKETKKQTLKSSDKKSDKESGSSASDTTKLINKQNNKIIKESTNSRHMEEMNNNNNQKSNKQTTIPDTKRKVTEMKIERLKKLNANEIEHTKSMLDDGFPSLTYAMNTTAITPPAYTATPLAPPGYGNSNNNNNNKKKMNPPPGFSVTLNSVARNNLTFTNSLGESYNILPVFKYLPPPNSMKRNQVLVTHFQQALKQTDAMENFRRISQMFRDGTYFTLPYYEHCKAALGIKFEEIFPELLALLPDITKQQELYLVHCQELKELTKNNKQQQQNQTKLKAARLEVCNVCKQVLISNDLLSHIQSHSHDSDFPSLNKQQPQKSQISTRGK